MKANGGGSIVSTASIAGLWAIPDDAAYCASKAGVVHLTKCIADEYLKRKIRANVVAPGGIDTPLQQEFMHMPEGVDWKAFRKVMSPLGNSTPEEIAHVVLFLASDETRYMTGAVVSVDGGITV
jgi:NAD(P)-dependent dehydrogenase (short-subunit alcohol dehydrogenase family)